MKNRKETFLLLGNYRPTITLARTYGRAGHDVIVTRGGGEGLSECSRYVSGVWDEPDPREGEEAFATALCNFLEEHQEVTVIVPVTERYAIAVARHRDKLPSDRLIASPSPKLVLATLDKPTLFETVDALDVPVAPFRRVSDYSSLMRAVAEVGTPAVIRPLKSEVRLAGQKALTIASKADLGKVLPTWPSEHEGMLVQRKVSGLRHNFYFAAHAGKIVRSVQTKILTTDHKDGSGLATDGTTIETMPQIAAFTSTILKALNYQGIGCAQYLVDDETGSINFLEINPRIAGNHAVPEAAGLDLGWMTVLLSQENAEVPTTIRGQAGLRYSWTYGAFRALKTRLQAGEEIYSNLPMRLWQIVRSASASRVHMTWSWTDPLPTIALFAKQLLPNTSALRTKPMENARSVSKTKEVTHA